MLPVKSQPSIVGSGQIVADAAVLGISTIASCRVLQKFCCDAAWRAKNVELHEVGSDHITILTGDDSRNWSDGSDVAQPQPRWRHRYRPLDYAIHAAIAHACKLIDHSDRYEEVGAS